MTRLTQVAPEEASGPLAETYGQIQRSFGGVPNFMQVLASSPTTLGGFLQLHDGLAHGKLDVRTRREYRHIDVSRYANLLKKGKNVLAIHADVGEPNRERRRDLDAGLYTVK